MKYIIDSNCFITPSRTFCPTDVGVSFWNKIKSLAEEGDVCSRFGVSCIQPEEMFREMKETF